MNPCEILNLTVQMFELRLKIEELLVKSVAPSRLLFPPASASTRRLRRSRRSRIPSASVSMVVAAVVPSVIPTAVSTANGTDKHGGVVKDGQVTELTKGGQEYMVCSQKC
jgi:hypothetical protein